MLWPMGTSACGVRGLWLVPAVQEEDEKSVALSIQSIRDWTGQGIDTHQQLRAQQPCPQTPVEAGGPSHCVLHTRGRETVVMGRSLGKGNAEGWR